MKGELIYRSPLNSNEIAYNMYIIDNDLIFELAHKINRQSLIKPLSFMFMLFAGTAQRRYKDIQAWKNYTQECVK